MLLSLNDIPIKTPNDPTGFTRSFFDLSKGGRTADGTMTKDIIAKKTKFFFSYQVISAEEMQTILDIIYFSSDAFFTFKIEDHQGIQTFTVYVGDISKKYFRKGSVGGWYYSGFTFNLIEQ